MIGAALTALKAIAGGVERSMLYETASGKNSGVYFDVVESESWSATARVTSKSIKKDDITFQMNVDPDTVSIRATLTNHTGINSLDETSLQRINPFGVDDQVSERLRILEEWREKAIPLTYLGSVRDEVENCVITSLNSTKNSGTGDSVELSISLQKLMFVEGNLVNQSLSASAKSTQKKGRVSTTSFLKKINNAISSLF